MLLEAQLSSLSLVAEEIDTKIEVMAVSAEVVVTSVAPFTNMV